MLVLSGKGGVGKSSVTMQLAVTLASQTRDGRPLRVGVLDIDLTGPSAPRMFGLDGPVASQQRRIHQSSAGWVPQYVDDSQSIGVVSIGFLLADRGDSVVWRGPKKTAMIRQFLTDVVWGELDYLLIDTPPGTSDEHISVVETLLSYEWPSEQDARKSSIISGAVLVTTPQQVATLDVRKELDFCRKVNVPIIGLVENMSGYICPHCADCTNIFSSGGGESMAREYGVEFLGRVPIDPRLVDLIEAQHYEANQEREEEGKGRSSLLLSRYKELEVSHVFSTITNHMRRILHDADPILEPVSVFEGHADRVWQAVQHPTLPLLATASSDKSARVWNTKTGQLVATLEGHHKRSVRSVAWRPSASDDNTAITLATASFDGTVGIWERLETDDPSEENWECVATLEGHENEVKCIVWSTSGSLLATCSRDKSVWIWEVTEDDEYECLGVMQEHTQDVKCVAWHPHEELLASCSYDDTIRLWRDDGDDWTLVTSLVGHESTVWSIAFDPDATTGVARLASASADGTLRIWKRVGSDPSYSRDAIPSVIRPSVSEEWTCVSEITPPRDAADVPHALYAVAWSKRSGRIACSGSEGTLFIYQEGSPNEWRLLTQLGHAHGVFEVNSVAWGTDGKNREVLYSAGDDSTARSWIVEE